MSGSKYILEAFCDYTLTQEVLGGYKLLIEIPIEVRNKFFIEGGKDVTHLLCYAPTTMFLGSVFRKKIPNLRYRLGTINPTNEAIPAEAPTYTTVDGIKIWATETRNKM